MGLELRFRGSQAVAAIIGLSSAVPRIPLVASGKLGKAQLDALARVLLTVSDPDQAAADLIALAIDGGGPDNVSCIVADVVAREEAAQV